MSTGRELSAVTGRGSRKYSDLDEEERKVRVVYTEELNEQRLSKIPNHTLNPRELAEKYNQTTCSYHYRQTLCKYYGHRESEMISKWRNDYRIEIESLKMMVQHMPDKDQRRNVKEVVEHLSKLNRREFVFEFDETYTRLQDMRSKLRHTRILENKLEYQHEADELMRVAMVMVGLIHIPQVGVLDVELVRNAHDSVEYSAVLARGVMLGKKGARKAYGLGMRRLLDVSAVHMERAHAQDA